MLIGKFKSKNPLLFFLLVFLAFLLWIDGFLFSGQTRTQYQSIAPLYNYVYQFANNYPFWSVLLSFLIMIAQAFMFNKVITDKNLVDRNSYLPALTYMVLMSSNFSLFGLHPVWFANFFLIISLNKVFDVFNEDDVFIEIFNVGLLVSLASLFYWPAFLLVILLFASLIVYYIFNIRGILASIIGFATPYLFVALYYFWYDLFWEKLDEIVGFFELIRFSDLKIKIYARVSLLVLSFFSLIALSHIYLRTMHDKTVRIRKRFQILLILLLVTVLSTLLAGEYLSIHHGLVMLPLAAIFAVYFQQSKKVFWYEMLFTLILLLILLGKLARLD
jgi:hypothetical protein